jgi:hypothetical protein
LAVGDAPHGAFLRHFLAEKRRRNDGNATPFWPNATPNRDDREKARQRNGLRVAHLCTKWRMVAHPSGARKFASDG